MSWTTRTISYSSYSGSCAINGEGSTIAYGYSGGNPTDGIQVIKNLGQPNEKSFFISIPGSLIPSHLFYGYGISVSKHLISTTGIAGNFNLGAAGTGDVFQISDFPSQLPNLTSEGKYIITDSNIYAPYFVGDGSGLINIQSSNIVQPFANLIVSGNVSAAVFYGDGGLLSNINTLSSVRSVTSGTYQIQPTDFYIGCNGTGITVTLPLGSSVNPGQTYVIKDESGLISGNSSYRFTIATLDSNTIDGSSSLTIVNSWTSVTVLWTGTKWSII
jgi:hypothetical protein